jgi:hypothetical protein
MNLMLVGVTGPPSRQAAMGPGTRRFGRAVRLPEGDVPAGPGSGVSKWPVADLRSPAASRRFVALSAEDAAWLEQDLSGLDLLAVQIDGIHLAEDLLLVAAVGIDGEGAKHPLGLVEGATENAAVVQALLDDLVKRGLDPSLPRLFIIDGAKALSKAIRRTFGRDTPIQRCQVHKARNILDRLPKHLHAPVRRTARGRPGNSTTPRRRRSCGASSPARCSARRRAWPGRSWRGSTRSSPWFASACRGSCAARSPAPASALTSAACAAQRRGCPRSLRKQGS